MVTSPASQIQGGGQPPSWEKIKKIAISRPRLERFWLNLAWWCSSDCSDRYKFELSKIQDGGGRYLGKIERSPYLGRGSSDFDKIWHNDAVWPSCKQHLWRSLDQLMGRASQAASPDITATEFHNFFVEKIADVWTSTDGANSAVYWPASGAVLDVFYHGWLRHDTSHSQQCIVSKIQDGGVRRFENSNNCHISTSISAISTKFGTVMQCDPLDHLDCYKFKI